MNDKIIENASLYWLVFFIYVMKSIKLYFDYKKRAFLKEHWEGFYCIKSLYLFIRD
ncbi:hypothetical protein V440_05920 [Clostridioides difficile]|nr:hypothetical protein V440_05920 [Clostridioides difficile]